ncbi:MAG: sle [Nocardioides sp.]|nr:sle [Nocardioides sp.]
MATNTHTNHDTVTTGRRISTETKSSTKTTELYAYVAAVVAVIVTAIVIGDNGDAPGGDSFGGSEAMRYITYLTIGYMIARGLAKSGARDYYDDTNNSSGRNAH